MKHVLLFLLAGALFAADADFNGQWIIRIPNARNRIGWLEVKGAGSGTITGSFVGAPGGQVDPITRARIEDGTLKYAIVRPANETRLTINYTVRIEGGKLLGSALDSEGRTSSFVGSRAPDVTGRDGPEWKAGTPVELFDGKSTNGWRLLVPGRPGWLVENGLLKNEKGASDLVSETKGMNFILRAEYRYGKGSNSGIAMRGRYEVQILDDSGEPASSHGHGALYSRVAAKTNASKAPGEWQQMEARIAGRDLTVTLNGVKVLDRIPVYPTAMAMDGALDQPGPIVLQGDHGLVEFRRITLIPLSR